MKVQNLFVCVSFFATGIIEYQISVNGLTSNWQASFIPTMHCMCAQRIHSRRFYSFQKGDACVVTDQLLSFIV